MSTRKNNIVLFLIVIFIFLSCRRITYEEHALAKYDGNLTWTEVTKKADWIKRYDHQVTVFNDKMWIIGGYNHSLMNQDPYLEDVWSSTDGLNWNLELENSEWLGRRGHEVVTFNNGTETAMYLIGGYSVNESTGKRQYNNDVWKSNDGKKWHQIKSNSKDSTSWSPRMHHKCVIANYSGQNYIYLIGGNAMDEGGDGRYAMSYFNDIWRSIDGENWEKQVSTNYGERSEHAVSVSSSGTIFIQGGLHGVLVEKNENSGINPIENYYDLWKSDDGSNWTNLNNIDIVENGLLSRSGHELIFYKNKLWALPGKTTSSVHYHFTEGNHYPTWTYDNTSDQWEIDSRGVAIDARHSYDAIVFKEKIWIIGGFTNSNGQANDIWTGELN